MKLSIILRPLSDKMELDSFIDMLSSAYGIDWQLIIQSFENENDPDETITATGENENNICGSIDLCPYSERITFANSNDSEYLYQASQLAVYDKVMVASAKDSYMFDIYAENADSDICVINNADYGDEDRDFESKEDIAGGLLTHSFPLNRCVIKTDLFRSKVLQNIPWDPIYENLLVSELLLTAESVEISQNVYLRDFKPVRISYNADDILIHSGLISRLLSISDEERIFYMISDFFMPVFRDAENGKINRRCFEFIKAFANIISSNEKCKGLLDTASGYNLSESLRFGYYYFAVFVAERASVENNKLQDIQRKMNAQNKKLDGIDKAVQTALKHLDTAQSAQEKLDISIKALDNKTNTMIRTVDSCANILKRPDMLMLNDNLFYLSETLAALYEQCKNITSMLGKEDSGK